MTQEQKAKAYDEALERAKKIHSEIVNNEIIGFPGQIETIFPQLRESEDERIRKKIIEHLEMIKMGCVICTIDTSEEIAWIKKQKEQKHPDGCFTCDEYKKGYEAGRLNGITAGYNKAMKEQKPISQEDFDAAKHEALWGEQKPNYCHYGGDPNVERCKYCSAACSARLTEEQKPELVQHPPITFTFNSNASRDERLKAALLALLNSDLLKVKEGGYFTKQDLIDWVERIPTDKPSEWKPSEEQIEALRTAVNKLAKTDVANSVRLSIMYDNLKKLYP